MYLRVVVIFVVLFVGGLSASAQRCKFLVDDKDPITDDIIRTIKTRITGPISGITPYYYFYYIRSGKNYKFKVEVADYGELTAAIPEQSELIIRLSDGALIRIYSIKKAPAQKLVAVSQVLTYYEIDYEISEEDISKIAKAGITFIRGTDFNNTFSDQKIPTPITQQSKENAICVFED